MEIEIKITADEKALEFSRNLGGIANYFMEALQTNAMEEHGIAVRHLAEPENQTIEVPTIVMPQAQPIEPDPVHYVATEPVPTITAQTADPAPSVEDARKTAMEFAKANGKEAMRLILDKLGAPNISSLDAEGRRLAVKLMSEASHA